MPVYRPARLAPLQLDERCEARVEEVEVFDHVDCLAEDVAVKSGAAGEGEAAQQEEVVGEAGEVEEGEALDG